MTNQPYESAHKPLRTEPTTTQRQVLPRATKAILIALGLAIVAGAGGWYTHEGFATSPDPAASSFFKAVRQRDNTGAYALLTSTSQQQLTPEQFSQLASGLGPLFTSAAEQRLTTSKDTNLLARHATLPLPESALAGADDLPTPPLRLELEHGRWHIDAAAIYARAMLNTLSSLDQMIPRGGSIEGHFSKTADVEKAASTERDQADKLLLRLRTWSTKAHQLDATFTGDMIINRGNKTRKELELALAAAVKSTRISRARNKIGALLTQAEDLYRQDENDQAKTLYEQVLADGNATNGQRATANYFLLYIASEGVDRERNAALEEANRSYDRAQYTEAIAGLQDLIDQDDLTAKMRGRANYLLSFVYRDDKNVPNNMQKSIDASRAATEAVPDSGEYWCTLGDRLRQYEVRGESSRSFLKGISLAADNVTKANCYVWYGWNLYASEDYSGAQDAWYTALDLEPTNPDALRALKQ